MFCSFKKHINIILLLSIFLLSFLARLYFLSQESTISTDGVSYVLAGKNLIENGRYEAFGNPATIYPPTYPIAIGIADYFFNDLLFSARLISFVSGTLLIWLFYLIGKKMRNKETGLYAAFFAGTNINLILMSTESFSESLYLFFVLLIIYLYLILINNNKVLFAILLGMTIGLAYLTRPEGLLFIILAFLFFFQKRKEIGIKKALNIFIIIAISFTVTSSPYVCFLYRNTGNISLTSKSASNLIAGQIIKGNNLSMTSKEEFILYEKTFSHYDEKTNSIKLPEEFSDIGLKKSIFGNTSEFFSKYINGLKTEIDVLLNEYNIGIFFISLFSLIFLLLITKKHYKNILAFFLFPILLLGIFPIFHIESRYLLQVWIFIILLSAFGCTFYEENNSFGNFKSLRNKVFLSVKITTLIMASLLFCAYLISYLHAKHSYPSQYEYKLAGEFIKEKSKNNYKDNIIMARKPEVAFYAQGQRHIPVPYTSAENVLKFAKANKVNYIVIDDRYLSVRESYNDLVDLDKHFSEVKLFYENNSVKPIKVFEVVY